MTIDRDNFLQNKLELVWPGKEQLLRPEPRILNEQTRYNGDRKGLTDNLLIYGDNLLGLKALEHQYAGKVKCVYIDPPYNTKSCFDHYDDSMEHSMWLDMIKERLIILQRLLSKEGTIWISIDNNESHYLKVLCDEIFGRKNFLTQIAYERSGSAGIGQGGRFLVNNHEYILVYAKEVEKIKFSKLTSQVPIEKKTMQRYRYILKNKGERKLIHEFNSKSNNELVKLYKHSNYEIETIPLKDFDKNKNLIFNTYKDNFTGIFRTTNPQKENSFQTELITFMDKALYSVDYVPSRGKNNGIFVTNYYLNNEILAWLKDTAIVSQVGIFKENKMTDFWNHADIPKANLANEGGVEFRRGKKPENLLHRILDIATSPHDIVLDCFAGSGTTGAVAHKMGRRWIMIEMGDHAKTHIIPRLKKVIEGNDRSGITTTVDWEGGGGFRFCEIAPSLLQRDALGRLAINKNYTPQMLKEAMCLHAGFALTEHSDAWWCHGQSTQGSYVYVTPETLTRTQLARLSHEVGSDRSCLVFCGAFTCASDEFDNLTIQKIPKSILSKCDWDQEDYSLKNKPTRSTVDISHSKKQSKEQKIAAA